MQNFINKTWDDSITPTLVDYIKIPNKSPVFDADWEAHGYMEQAVQLIADWCKAHAAKGMTLEIVREPGRTPVILMDIPGEGDKNILMYGHFDKQPEMVGWEEDLGPWRPVIRDDKLYGRGGADDGYSAFSALTAINALQAQNIPHPRCVILIEACEESGSYDLPFYVDKLRDQIGTPDLVICLDSGAGNYEQLWGTTSLRGVINATLNIEMLTEGIHSGFGTGTAASTFRVLRQLLSRIEDENTGDMLLPELSVDIPAIREQQAILAADTLQNEVIDAIPLAENVQPVSNDIATLLLNRTWRASLEVTGMDHIPSVADGGSVLRPQLAAKLSVRIPPTCDVDVAVAALKETLEANAPYNARVSFTPLEANAGWHAPQLNETLAAQINEASQVAFGKPAMYFGEGGTIPFMGMLGDKFPEAQFFITGVLGPKSNAHGPNEFLHLPFAKKITACVAHVLAAQCG
ncbi:MAG: peptidase M20 [marine bacterium B5-7]|nr:MAG: peptidase M20 [marine bacterium B5-7]